uniref:EF-hand domain-containing protein n=1 Tax=Quercus lobata TaxID=97700 RepID=A0A7N2LG38_QUELO
MPVLPSLDLDASKNDPIKVKGKIELVGDFLCMKGLRSALSMRFLEDCDLNLDGEIDHEEFVKFIQQLTAETLIAVSQGLIVSLVVAPTVAMATKRATEGVPGVGKVVQRLPNSVYASLVTIAVVFIQQSIQESD